MMSHFCHWAGCQIEVPPNLWGCKPHWFRLPKSIRVEIWSTYRPGQEINKQPSVDYMAVADAAQNWIEKNATEKLRISLREIQDKPEKLLSLTITSLAWLTHEAEQEEDDLTFIAIQNILEARTAAENQVYNDEYRRLWSEHAKFRGYERK